MLDPVLLTFASEVAEVWLDCGGFGDVASTGKSDFFGVWLVFPLGSLSFSTDGVVRDELPFLFEPKSPDILVLPGAAISGISDDCASLGVRSPKSTLVDCDRFFRLKNLFMDFVLVLD